jgi:hypothetical protein
VSKSWQPTTGHAHSDRTHSTARNAAPLLPLPPGTPHAPITMPGPKNTILIEGTFEELTDEFAQYIDSLKKSQGDEASNLQGETADLLKENKKDDVLKKLVVGGQALNQAPEKGRSAILL